MNPQNIHILLKSIWGATESPFAETTASVFETPEIRLVLEQIEQFLSMHSSGVLCGPNGSGKSLILDAIVQRLPEKTFTVTKLSHASVTGSDLLRSIVRACGIEPCMWRSNNVNLLLKHWHNLGSLHPVIILDEAQQLENRAMEEIRLLCADRAQLTGKGRTPAFSLLLCGDEDLLPTLQMGVCKALRSRLGFCLHTAPLTAEQTTEYVNFRWKQCNVLQCPFDDQALTLVYQATEGIPRNINQLGAVATTLAAQEKDHVIRQQHVQKALHMIPWMALKTIASN
ncbi:MAG: AAA family ATPase [Desulfobulbaceae bacterium]